MTHEHPPASLTIWLVSSTAFGTNSLLNALTYPSSGLETITHLVRSAGCLWPHTHAGPSILLRTFPFRASITNVSEQPKSQADARYRQLPPTNRLPPSKRPLLEHESLQHISQPHFSPSTSVQKAAAVPPFVVLLTHLINHTRPSGSGSGRVWPFITQPRLDFL